MDTTQLKRIADAIEEILRLVKQDQERSRKYMEKESEDPFIKTMEAGEREQAPWITNGQGLPWPCAMAHGSGTELQATSHKLQASSRKLDKIKL